ncbi:cytochrome c biogenesis protein CcsA, partial [Omnitrophica bacterium]|nr:cytochrome c biogenesis protein CcsA [Candidatus Omnitrophota bacterium]
LAAYDKARTFMSAALGGQPEEVGENDFDPKELSLEVTYLRARPFHWAWILYLASFLLTALNRFKLIRFLSLLAFAGGFAVQTYGFYLRSVIAGRPPVSNMYESLIWVSWTVSLFALIYFWVNRSVYLRNTAALVSFMTLILAQQFPAFFSPSISPLVPVLRSNLWLTLHVLTVTMSYGAFALAWGLGHGLVFSFVCRGAQAGEHQKKLSAYLYRTLQVGVVLLAAGTVLGGIWANYSWGRYWGWDPKETWALIALLGYLAVLHGAYANWYGDFGIAVGAVIAFLGVVMAWYGVNYVLGAGLHSYGFGAGGAGYVGAAALLDVGWILWMAARIRK